MPANIFDTSFSSRVPAGLLVDFRDRDGRPVDAPTFVYSVRPSVIRAPDFGSYDSGIITTRSAGKVPSSMFNDIAYVVLDGCLVPFTVSEQKTTADAAKYGPLHSHYGFTSFKLVPHPGPYRQAEEQSGSGVQAQPSAEVQAPDILQYFDFEHLPNHLQEISRPLHAIAHFMASDIPASPELSAGLRKLLEAKDCFVRAKLTKPTRGRT